MNYKKLQTFAEKTAIKAGKLLLKEQNQFTVVKQKDVQDLATSADIKSEKIIIDEIEKRFPNHNIFSEEVGLINKNSDYEWVLDPLDGTKEYARGMSLYCVLISCEKKGKLIASCAYLPRTQELFSASFGNGSFLSKNKLKVTTQDKFSHSFIVTHVANSRVKEPEFTKIWNTTAKTAKQCYRLRPSNYDAPHLCWLALGAYDGYFVLHDKGPKWHDVASSLLVAQEAGAKVTDRFGKPIKDRNLNSGLVVTNGKIHDQLLEIINK